jgi:hypothetical protein
MIIISRLRLAVRQFRASIIISVLVLTLKLTNPGFLKSCVQTLQYLVFKPWSAKFQIVRIEQLELTKESVSRTQSCLSSRV